MLDRIFKLSQNGTCVKTEILAGLTTFMTMAYIVALNPNLLTNFGAAGAELWNGVFLATCIASAIGTFCMAFLANKPFAMAPGSFSHLPQLSSSFSVSSPRRLCSSFDEERISSSFLSSTDFKTPSIVAVPILIPALHSLSRLIVSSCTIITPPTNVLCASLT